MRSALRSPFVMAAVTAFALLAPLAAQTRPNFSGEWVLVLDKSDFGPLTAPLRMTRTITHTDPTFKFVTIQTTAAGEVKSEATFTTDGKPQQNAPNGTPMTTTGKWDGSTMVFSSTITQQGQTVSIEDRYVLSDAGKTLTVTRAFSSADGQAKATIVFTKK